MDDHEGEIKPQEGKTLADLLKSQPKGTWSQYDPRLFTKEDYQTIGPDHPMDRLMALFNYAPDRELVSQLGGRAEKMLKSLVLTKLVQPMGRAAFKAKFARPQSHSRRIEIARRAGLIDAKLVSALNGLAFVRNEFGHDPDLHFFEHSPEVASKISEVPITFAGASFPLPLRTLFFFNAINSINELEAKMSQPHIILDLPANTSANYSWRWC